MPGVKEALSSGPFMGFMESTHSSQSETNLGSVASQETGLPSSYVQTGGGKET